MSKSNLPVTNTELEPTTPQQPHRPASLRPTGAVRTPRQLTVARRCYIWFAATVRWLHIYISLLGFSSLVFFGVTGITLNHPDWFGTGSEHVREASGQLQRDWVVIPDNPSRNADAPESSHVVDPSADHPSSEDADPATRVARFEIVEYLRSEHRLKGAVSEFRVDEAECLVLFKGPGYAADVVINRETGQFQIVETVLGLVAVINDLHKGRDTGPTWSWVIDISAVVTVVVSITGLILIFYIKRKRATGVVTAVVGTALLVLAYWLGIA